MSRIVHGGIQDNELRRLGLDPAAVLDLSANLHPIGPHPAVTAAWRGADVTRYPDPEARPLREAIAAASNLEPAQVLVTPGANAALHLAARALPGAGERSLYFPPTYGEYEAAIEAAGGEALAWPSVYAADPPRFVRGGVAPPAPLAFLCNPNNPTGEYLPRGEVEALLHTLGGTLVLDVAYDPFVAAEEWWDADALVREGAPVVVVHSFTKLHAIPGLRVGYVTGSAPVIARLAALQPAWAIGAPEQAAALAAIAVDAEQRAAVTGGARGTEGVGALRDAFAVRLVADGWTVVAGRANYLLVEAHSRDGRGGGRLRAALLRRGFVVRNCASMGLPAWARIAVPPASRVEELAEALAAARGELMRAGPA